MDFGVGFNLSKEQIGAVREALEAQARSAREVAKSLAGTESKVAAHFLMIAQRAEAVLIKIETTALAQSKRL